MNQQSPYRSGLRNRLVDLAIVVGIALVVGALADAALGQRWFYEGCYTDDCGNLVCNSQMPRPALPPGWQSPPVGRPAEQAPQRKSIYAGPLPPRDQPAPGDAGRGTNQAQLDATGWTSAPSSTAPAAASQPVAQPNQLSVICRPAGRTIIVLPPRRLPSRYDDDWRHAVEGRTQTLEFAVGHLAQTEIPQLRRTLDERTATLADQIDGLPFNPFAVFPVAAAGQPSDALPPPPAPEKIIERVEVHKPSTYLELIAQIALVAGGSAATLGSGYGVWWAVGKAGLKLAGYYHRKHFFPRDADDGDSSAGRPSTVRSDPRPAATTYAWSRVAQSAVPVDSPPVRQSAPPETHYVEVERDWTAKAHQWADEQIARKYADHRLGTVELLSARDALVKQYLASRRS
jgi:hypothetical protein